ncbi:hypothetical protein D9M70_623840 [compost metagenome]
MHAKHAFLEVRRANEVQNLLLRYAQGDLAEILRIHIRAFRAAGLVDTWEYRLAGLALAVDVAHGGAACSQQCERASHEARPYGSFKLRHDFLE